MKMNIEYEAKSYWLPDLRRSVDISRGQIPNKYITKNQMKKQKIISCTEGII